MVRKTQGQIGEAGGILVESRAPQLYEEEKEGV